MIGIQQTGTAPGKIRRFALIAAAGMLLAPASAALAGPGAPANSLRGQVQEEENTPPYIIGKPLPEHVAYAPVPPRIMVVLGAAPKGHVYGLVGEDVLLIALKTRRVVEALAVSH